ncbi:flippase [Pedobacter sp. SD-b]|uniref:Flippase n=1 Tax=Pedobacter segetis TaxID=2793069 RepID=A0ABS1BG04_9SPHI|nr:flippase [Pedobacter segetis]MBK0381726.1 flippase [Pedobacter segetis]
MRGEGNYWIRSGFINVLQNFASVIFGFGSFFFLVRVLSKHDFGEWTVYMTTITILNIFRDGLIKNALIKFLSGASEEDKPKIMTAAFTINMIITVVIVVLNLALGSLLARLLKSPDLVNLFYLFNIIYVLNGVLTQFNCIEQANLKFKGVFVSNTVFQAIYFFYVLYCFVFNVDIPLYHLVVVQIFGSLVAMVIAYFYTRSYLNFAFGFFKTWMIKLFNYGKYAFGTSMSSILSGSVDQMMLSGIISPIASGVFNVAVKIVNLIDIPTTAVANIVFPQSAKRMETEGKESIKYLYEKSVGTILAILIPGLIFIYIFPDFILYLLAGNKYTNAGSILRVTLLYTLLIPFGRQFGTILDSIGKTKTTFYIVVVTAATNLILNYFFILNMGIIGAAYATLISNILGFTIAQIILRKELGVKFYHAFVYAYRFYPEFYQNFVKPQVIRFKNKGKL